MLKEALPRDRHLVGSLGPTSQDCDLSFVFQSHGISKKPPGGQRRGHHQGKGCLPEVLNATRGPWSPVGFHCGTDLPSVPRTPLLQTGTLCEGF